ncbi:hypothetical protein FACS1894178_2370 [Bacteroidia bacterium]|nr:hypothetical protein FACS1894178_2370 [Bacteroidia bacterium]
MKNLKLNKIAEQNLNEKQMHQIRGGASGCSCGCQYANNGGSSISNNGMANADNGLHAPSGVKVQWACSAPDVIYG